MYLCKQYRFFMFEPSEEPFIESKIKGLKTKLNGDLPGERAHRAMIPEGRNLYPKHSDKPRQSAVLILLYQDQNSLYFPLILRPKYNGIHSGQMALPGGKKEKADKNLIHTALRESCEEVGVCRDAMEILGSLSELYIPVTNMTVLPVVAIAKNKPEFIIKPDEVAGLFLVDIQEMLNPENKISEHWLLRGNKVKVPFYYLKKQKVWGATAMILSELEQLLTQ